LFRDPYFIRRAEYKGDIFAAFHRSWNPTKRTGYKIVRVPFDHSTGKARGGMKTSLPAWLRLMEMFGAGRRESQSR